MIQIKQENPKIRMEDVLVVTKQSKVEYDMERLGINYSKLLEFYKRDGVPLERVTASHERQESFNRELLRHFNADQIIKFTLKNGPQVSEAISGSKLVIAAGGDNHFQRVARLVSGQILIAGINSDPETSRGAILNFKSHELEALLNKLATGGYSVEEWTRIKIRLDEEDLLPALCDVFLGERERQYMSRYLMSIDGREVEQKSSGLLVATGAGSGGWFRSATAYLFPEDPAFPRTARELKFAATELSKSGNTDLPYGAVTKSGQLVVQSLNDSEGILAVDSLSNYSFGPGHTAELSPDEISLRSINK